MKFANVFRIVILKDRAIKMKSNTIRQIVNKFLGATIIATLLIGFSHNTVARTIVGTYQLKNKVFGAIHPPEYGLRLNGLFSGNSNDHWTFDFEHTGAKVYLQTIDNGAGDYDLHLFGTVFGGKDIGGGYLGGSTGFWDLDFTYSAAVTVGLGNDSKSVLVDRIPDGGFGNGTLKYIGDAANGGAIQNLTGNNVDESSLSNLTIDLIATSANKTFSFCYGSFAGISTPNGCGPQLVNGEQRVKGSGWLQHGVTYGGAIDTRVAHSDFGVTGVAAQIPEPATLLLTGLGLIGLMIMRRQRSRI